MPLHLPALNVSSAKRDWSAAAGWQTVLLALGIAAGAGGTASAADIPAVPEAAVAAPASGWTFTVAPYVWAPSTSGNVGFGTVKASFEMDFSQIWDHLDFAAMGVVEARHDRFSIFSDLLYMKLSADAKLPYGIGAELGTELLQWTPAAAYSLIKTDRGNFDVLAGARLWSVEASLNITDAPLQLGLDRRHRATWVDAVVGVKAQYSLTESVFVSGWAIAGGGSSDYNWDLLGAVGYKVNDRFSAMAGYRAQGIDYEDGPFVFDAVIQGPILGGTIKF